jgi:integrase
MPSLRRRKDRGNRYQLHYVDVDGTRYRIDTKTSDLKIAKLFKNKAEDLLSQAKLGIILKVGRIDADTIAGKTKEETSLTLEEFREKYQQRCKEDLDLSDSTIENNNLAFKSLIGVVGDIFIDVLTDENIVLWKTTMLHRGRSRTTVGIYFRHLRAAFNRAVKWKLTESNPFLLVEETKDKGRKPKKDMSIEEVRRLLSAIDETGDYKFGIYIKFLLYTGCRRTEVLYLKWEDIDLEQNKLLIYQEKTKRELEIPIIKALRRIIEEMEMQSSGFVFQTYSHSRGARRKKKPWNKDYVSHHFKGYIRALGLPAQYTLHSIRHTYTNLLLKKGVPLDIVQKLLGHTSVRTTGTHYDHTVALHFRDYAESLSDFEEE